MVRGSAAAKNGKVVSEMSALGPKSSLITIADSPGDRASRRGSTRGQNSADKPVVAEVPKGAPVRSGKRNLESSLAVVPLVPNVPATGDGVPPGVLVDSSAAVGAALATIDEQEALSISLPVAAHIQLTHVLCPYRRWLQM